MILFKKNQQKTETDHGQEEQTWGSGGKSGRSVMHGHLGGLGHANCCIWNG